MPSLAMKFSAVLTTSLLLQGCVTNNAGDGGSSLAYSIGQIVEASCQFIPSALDIAAFLEVTGASKAKVVADKICTAVQQSKAEIAAAAGPVSPGRTAALVPPGTTLSLEVDGVKIRGVTKA